MTQQANDRRLLDRVVVVTGAGRGLGAEYAKQAAAAGARVVVNDLGGGVHGERTGDPVASSPAQRLVDEIVAAGGAAVADASDVSDFDGAAALIDRAIEEFGRLDVLINNAGILRDRMLTNMSAEEFDDVVRAHLRGHFATSRHAASYWKERAKDAPTDSVLIQTTSIAGLHGNVGQFNYSAAKAGIAVMAINAHHELNARYGVRSYAIAPGARTRLTLSSPGAVDAVQPPEDGGFDFYGPQNVAPFVLWLAAQGCPAPSGTVYGVEGDLIRRYQPWTIAATVDNAGRPWTFGELDAVSADLADGTPVISAVDVIAMTAEYVRRLRPEATG